MKKILLALIICLTFMAVSEAGNNVVVWQDVDEAKTKEELQAACNKVREEYYILVNVLIEHFNTPQQPIYERIIRDFVKKYNKKCSEEKGITPRPLY